FQHLNLPGMVGVVLRDADDHLSERPALAVRNAPAVTVHGDSCHRSEQPAMLFSQQGDVGAPGAFIVRARHVRPIRWRAWKPDRITGGGWPTRTLELPPDGVLPIRNVQCEFAAC